MDTILSILVLLTFALLAGAAYLWRRGGDRRQVGLMILLAIVTAINVGIWTLPDTTGRPPASNLPR